MWTIIFLVLVFRTAVLSSPPCPTNVTFSSVNLRNVLRWSPGHDTPAHTKYTVQYAIYGDREGKRAHWRKVLHCFEITRHWCDLSLETWDLEHGYMARVRAASRKNNSKWVEANRRLEPPNDTEFGPPSVSVEIENNNAIVTIEGPMRHVPHNHTPGVSMATLYPNMGYNLSVHNTHTGQIHHFPLTTNVYTYRMMDYATEYCFSATTMIVHLPVKHHPSVWHCITTPQDPLIDQLKIIVVGIVVPAVFLCLLASLGYVLYNYLSGKDQKSPYILNKPSFHPSPLPLPPENFTIIVISPSKDKPYLGKDKFYPELLPISSPIQRPETPASPPEEPCDDSSVDYGFVASKKEHTEVVNVRQCNMEEQSYKNKELQIEAESSGGTYASQNSFLQALWSPVNPMLLNQLDGNQQSLVLHKNPATVSMHLQNNTESPNEGGSSAGGNDLLFTGYASQSVAPANQLHDLQDDYGILGVVAVEDGEDEGAINIDWDPATRKLVIPGLDSVLGERKGVKLETVFVRQPSEEEALLGTEDKSVVAEWDTEDLVVKWNLVVSSDVSL